MPGISAAVAQPPLVLVLDVGSSSVRGSIYDALARPVDGLFCQQRYELHTTADGGVEADAGAMLGLVIQVIDQTIAAAGTLVPHLAAVGMATFASSLVGVDGDEEPLTPVFAYSDTRPAPDVLALRALVEEEAVHERTGCRLHTSYLPARLHWLCRTLPDTYERVRRWLSLPEYLLLKLTGEARCSLSIASWTGLLNRYSLAWDAELRSALDVNGETLSPISDQSMPSLLPAFAGRWPVLAQVPWFPSWADGAAANIGAGCGTPDGIALSIGTTGALRVVTTEAPAKIPRGLWCYRVDRNRALVGGATNEGGGVVAWLRETFQFPDFEADEEAIRGAEPDGHGLTVLPFLKGERAPGWDADMRATITGISAATTPRDILQATLEAIAYRFGLIADELAEVFPGATRIVAGGGGAAGSPVWMQIIADVLNRPVALADEAETTSRGVALLTLARLGVDTSAIPPPAIEQVFQAHPGRHARYRAAMARQRRLYDLLADWGRQERTVR